MQSAGYKDIWSCFLTELGVYMCVIYSQQKPCEELYSLSEYFSNIMNIPLVNQESETAVLNM